MFKLVKKIITKHINSLNFKLCISIKQNIYHKTLKGFLKIFFKSKTFNLKSYTITHVKEILSIYQHSSFLTFIY